MFLFFFTPLSDIILNKDSVSKSEILELLDQTDSLAVLVDQQAFWIDNVKAIASGKINLEDLDSLYLTDFSPNMVNLNDTISRRGFKIMYVSQNNLLNILSFHRPTNGILIDTFNLDRHLGVDISTKEKEKIFSVLSGSVFISGENKNFGKFIIINHPDNIMSIYMHANNIIKERGDIVERGDIIGYTGNTGALSNGNHLHFELKHEGVNVDPQKYITF